MSEIRDNIEFYCDGKMVATVKSSFIMECGHLVSIRKKTYKVRSVTFALDNTDDRVLRAMRMNVDLSPV